VNSKTSSKKRNNGEEMAWDFAEDCSIQSVSQKKKKAKTGGPLDEGRHRSTRKKLKPFYPHSGEKRKRASGGVYACSNRIESKERENNSVLTRAWGGKTRARIGEWKKKGARESGFEGPDSNLKKKKKTQPSHQLDS